MRRIDTFTCLAFLPLAGLVTVAAAQQGTVSADVGSDVPTCQSSGGGSRTAAECGEESTSVVRAEKEFTISLDARSQDAPACNAQVSVEYLQWGAATQVDGVITNEDCAASSGEYEIQVRVRDDNGELSSLSFNESWQRDDDQPVAFSTEYPIGDNVDLIRVWTRKVDCACAPDANGSFAALAVDQEADVADTTVADLPSPAVVQVEEAAEVTQHTRRELRRERRLRREAEEAASAELECRSVKVTGSRMPSRTCATPEEWEAFDAQTEEAAAEILRRGQERTIFSTPQSAPPF